MLKGAFSKVNRALVGQRHVLAARIPIIIINLAPNDFAKVRLSRAARAFLVELELPRLLAGAPIVIIIAVLVQEDTNRRRRHQAANQQQYFQLAPHLNETSPAVATRRVALDVAPRRCSRCYGRAAIYIAAPLGSDVELIIQLRSSVLRRASRAFPRPISTCGRVLLPVVRLGAGNITTEN